MKLKEESFKEEIKEVVGDGPTFDDDTELAAKSYSELVPVVRNGIRALAKQSAKGLARVVIAATEFPYSEKYPKFRSHEEQQLFVLLLQLNQHKFELNKAMEPYMEEVKAEVVNKTANEAMERITNMLPNKEEEANGNESMEENRITSEE